MPSWRKVITSGSDAALNSLNVTTSVTASAVSATTFIGDLTGTASYATQALSASWAPGGNPFPFTGDAQISGSLGVTGSFSVLDSNGTNKILIGSGPIIGAGAYINQTIDSSARNTFISLPAQPVGQTLEGVTFNSAVSPNDLVYLETDDKWYQTNQTTDTSTKMLGICISSNPFMGYQGTVFTEGDLVVTTGMGYPYVQNANYGLPIYIRASGGTQMSTTIPTSGYVRVLGYVYHNSGTEWIMKFRPSNDWYVI